jgi:hypothetical protein
MAFQAQAYLYDAKAEKYEADGADEAEDEVGQVVYDSNGVIHFQ